MDRVFVQHPISDQTLTQLNQKADDALDSIVEGLTSQSARPILGMESELELSADDCSA